MSPTTEVLLAVFTGLVALALLLQGFALLAILRKIRDLAARLDAVSTKLTKQVDSLTEQADSFLTVLKGTAEKVSAVQDNVTAISRIVHQRVLDVDAFINEATNAARLQIARLQDVIDTTSSRINETIDTLQTAIITPISEAQAVVRGIRSALDVLFGRRRSSSSRLHQDEELFI
ncbi:MAG: hypothetical protein LAP85_00015 [Acidobacteriia bacterium]|nr:hypothetical protein [Terriglobia bacterium]